MEQFKQTLFGKRATERWLTDLVAGRGARRKIRREAREARMAARPAFVPTPTVRCPVRIQIARARREFSPGSYGHTNAIIKGTTRVARRIAELGLRRAVSFGYGDKKVRVELNTEGVATRTTRISRSWREYYQRFTKVKQAETKAVDKAEHRRKSMNPFKRGYQAIKDMVS